MSKFKNDSYKFDFVVPREEMLEYVEKEDFDRYDELRSMYKETFYDISREATQDLKALIYTGVCSNEVNTLCLEEYLMNELSSEDINIFLVDNDELYIYLYYTPSEKEYNTLSKMNVDIMTVIDLINEFITGEGVYAYEE